MGEDKSCGHESLASEGVLALDEGTIDIHVRFSRPRECSCKFQLIDVISLCIRTTVLIYILQLPYVYENVPKHS